MTDTPNTTQGKSAIDWSRPIEGLSYDGEWQGAKVEDPADDDPRTGVRLLDGSYVLCNADGRGASKFSNDHGKLVVRNVPEHPTPTQYAPELVDSDQPSVESEMIGMLTRDHARMRVAGTKLAEAALYVVREHDGLHRLALAVSEWATALASEGDRSVNGVGAEV